MEIKTEIASIIAAIDVLIEALQPPDNGQYICVRELLSVLRNRIAKAYVRQEMASKYTIQQ